jgi:hypothetical protein
VLQRSRNAPERLAEHRHQRLAFIRERQAARQAAKQRLAQPVLQIADVLAHGRLAHVEFVGSAREIQVAGRHFEGAQGVEGQVHAWALRH